MKYCTKCGAELEDTAKFCTSCGESIEGTAEEPEVVVNPPVNEKTNVNGEETTLQTVAKVFMILACIKVAVALIPLAWCIPMTVSYFRKVENHEEVSTGFKVCTLLFVGLVPGILMLCDKD